MPRRVAPGYTRRMSPDERENGGDGPEIATSTLAEIYAEQGLFDRALRIYRRIADRVPDDPRVQARIAELTAAARAEEPEAEPPPRADIPIPPDGETEPDAGPEPTEAEEAGPPLEELAARTGPPEAAPGREGPEPPPAERDEEFLAWLGRR